MTANNNAAAGDCPAALFRFRRRIKMIREGVPDLHLPRQSESQGHTLAVDAAGCGGVLTPLVATVLFAFLSIRVEDASILDFLRYAVCFLCLKQQYYEWGEHTE